MFIPQPCADRSELRETETIGDKGRDIVLVHLRVRCRERIIGNRITAATLDRSRLRTRLQLSFPYRICQHKLGRGQPRSRHPFLKPFHISLSINDIRYITHHILSVGKIICIEVYAQSADHAAVIDIAFPIVWRMSLLVLKRFVHA